ncbi:hypothetical protein PROFUN_02988 [Planoprotostelium fungivorum]|uniref:Uncharacterized protein n=1 Tax=Planoprotostelium fungivorum TaxID=1890364 RepID=A0A2P6NXA1_9EUKA|nr:hypothetical protein PROFUN_02988 [Planoprotostelium fungivorum]
MRFVQLTVIFQWTGSRMSAVDETVLYSPTFLSVDHDDEVLCGEYSQIIFDILYTQEEEQLAHDNFMKHQKEMTHYHRRVIVDWLADVCNEFQCVNETFFLSVKLLDRYLTLNRDVEKNDFQLVAVTCLSLAAKFEQGLSPSVAQLEEICDGAYAPEVIVDMEVSLLALLDFQVSLVHPMHFLRRYSRAAKCGYFAYNLSKYLCELSMTSAEHQLRKPSLLAAASVYAAQKMLGVEEPWTQQMTQYTSYQSPDVDKMGRQLLFLFVDQQHGSKDKNKEPCNALFRKYSAADHYSVSKISPHSF